MRAMVFDRYGDEQVLRLTDLPDPEPDAGRLLVRVAATSVNPADWRLRSGQMRRFIRLRLPFVPGHDVAGVVERVGPGVQGFAPGDAVIAMQPTRLGGASAELVAVDAEHAAHAPEGMSLADAAALPLVGLTALQALRDRAGLTALESDGALLRVLVYGAGGGVGTAAVQLASLFGARITAVAAGRHRDLVEALGVDRFADRTAWDSRREAGEYAAVLDAVPGLGLREMLSLLVARGRGVTVHPARGLLVPDALAVLRRGRIIRSVVVRPSGQDLATLAGWASEGRFRSVVARRLPLAEIAAAQRDSATHTAPGGKTVLVVDERLAALTPASARPAGRNREASPPGSLGAAGPSAAARVSARATPRRK